MKMLAFDTSAGACSIALLNGETVTYSHQVAPMQQAKLILPGIQQLLNEANLTLKDLDAITYGQGPGSFTGIRIAASIAQGLGYVANLPIIPVSSLAILAQTGWLTKKWDRCLVIVDAHTEQVYWAMYVINERGYAELKEKEQLSSPQDIKIPDNTKWYGVGDAWDKYGEKWENNLLAKPDAGLLPHALALLELGKVKFEQREWVKPSEAFPTYLR